MTDKKSIQPRKASPKPGVSPALLYMLALAFQPEPPKSRRAHRHAAVRPKPEDKAREKADKKRRRTAKASRRINRKKNR